jgi:thioesterase domain-containing protein
MPDGQAEPRRMPPQDVLHDQLAAVWERLLVPDGRAARRDDPIGIDDDFFALGGTPGTGAQMLAEVESLTGERIAWSEVAAPTIRGLADLLVARAPRAAVQTVQAGDRAVVPLFYLHGDLGGAGYYVRELARGLDARQPLHVLPPHGMHGDEIPPSAEAMADDMIRRLRAVHSTGPFHLGGYCTSATVAFEMARRLSAESSGLRRLFLIDPPIAPEPSAPRRPMPRLTPAQRCAPRIRGAWLFGEYAWLLQSYRPRPYAGEIAVLLARDGASNRAPVVDMWRALAPRATIATVAGTHRTAPGRHVRELARALRTHIAAPERAAVAGC